MPQWLKAAIPGFGYSAAIALGVTIIAFVVYYKFVGIALDRTSLLGVWVIAGVITWFIGLAFGKWSTPSK
jgi:uncharacterized membrane protein (DUF485 family)